MGKVWNVKKDIIEKQSAPAVKPEPKFTLAARNGRQVQVIGSHAFTLPIACYVYSDRALSLARQGRFVALRQVLFD